MRKLLVVFLLFQVVLFAQMNNTNRWIMRGDATTLTFSGKGDLSSDTLIFVVKASKDITAVRLIEKTTYDSEINISSGSNSFIYIDLLAGDTDDLTLAKYYYDITKIHNADTTTIFIGELNLQPDIGTPFDGTDVTGRVTTVSLNNGSTDRELVWWNDSLNYWQPSGVTFSAGGSVGNADSLGGVPASGYVDKTSSQTITGQKNFSGTVKFRSDTSITMGGLVGSYALGLDYYLKTANSYQVPLRFNVIDAYTAPWTITSGEVEWEASTTGKDHVFNIGYNWSGALTSAAQFGQQMESHYEQTDSLVWYEWFSYFNDLPSPSTVYNSRPFQVATARYGKVAPYVYSSSVGTSADIFFINDEIGRSLIEFRTQTYGTLTTESGGDGGSTLGNSEMYIIDSLWIMHDKNNFGWLYQLDNSSSARELLRIDEYSRVLIAPDGYTDTEFGGAINGQIKWHNNANTGFIPIEPDTKDVLVLGSGEGIKTQSIKINYIPDDTTDLVSGELYLHPSTGLLRYTIPNNLIVNGDFDDWTAWGTFEWADDWHNNNPDTAHAYIENVGNAMRVYHDGGNTEIGSWNSALLEIGKEYGYSYKVLSGTSDSGYFNIGNVPLMTDWRSIAAGNYTGTITALTTVSFTIAIKGTSDFILDDVKVWEIGGDIASTEPVILVPDTTGITEGYVQKYVGGEVIWSPDISTGGSGLFNPDGVWMDTSLAGIASFTQAVKDTIGLVKNKQNADADLTDLADGELTASKVAGVKDADYGDVTVSSGAWAVEDDSHNHVISNVDALQDSLTAKANTAWFAIAPHLIDDSISVKMNRSEMSGYATASHTHTDFFDTLSYSINIPDTVIIGTAALWKMPNDITITEIAACTDANTSTFNIEERGETTPNTAGTDVIGSDLVADTDQQETSTFTNATISKDNWLALTVSATGDVALLSITIKYIKTD